MLVSSSGKLRKTTTTTSPTTTRMAPNYASRLYDVVALPWRRRKLRREQEASSIITQEMQQKQEAIPVPEEPNLYYLPVDLSPTYKPIPTSVQAVAWFASALVATFISYGKKYPRLVSLQCLLEWKKILSWLLETVILATISLVVMQDILWPPARVPLNALRERYFLPSRLSQFDSELGLHYLQVTNSYNNCSHESGRDNHLPRYEALYVNHGFGASSLSWLPALPAMTSRLKCRIGLGHDAVGFGFSRRGGAGRSSLPGVDNYYTSTASANLGLQLLQKKTRSTTTTRTTTAMMPQSQEDKKEGARGTSCDSNRSVLLMGHSMGAITTLRMALQLPGPKDIVLVAPALGIRRSNTKNNNKTNMTSSISAHSPTSARRWLRTRVVRLKLKHFASVVPLSRCANLVAKYILRRVVGTSGFWKRGLQVAWGDPQRLKESDVLRFQWPSICQGWEQGLLDFAKAQNQPSDMTDKQLMAQVLQCPNTTVYVIVGSKDRIVPAATVKAFFSKDFPTVQLVEMEGVGHDPFEEDVEGFLEVVESSLIG